jgi:cell division protein FtsL
MKYYNRGGARSEAKQIRRKAKKSEEKCTKVKKIEEIAKRKEAKRRKRHHIHTAEKLFLLSEHFQIAVFTIFLGCIFNSISRQVQFFQIRQFFQIFNFEIRLSAKFTNLSKFSSLAMKIFAKISSCRLTRECKFSKNYKKKNEWKGRGRSES